MDDRLTSHRFPRSAAYDPDRILAGVSGGANPLWMARYCQRHKERNYCEFHRAST